MSHFFYQLYLMSEHTPKTNTFSLICSVFRTQALLPVSFSRQEYWSGLPCPPPGDLPNQGSEPVSLMFSALAGRFFTTRNTWEALIPRGHPT